MSEQFYQEPSEGEMRSSRADIPRSKNGWRTLKALFTLVMWVAVLGGGGAIVGRAAWMANQPQSFSGSGAQPAMNMMSFCMNLVDFGWNDRVEKRIQSNPRPTLPPIDLREVDLGTEIPDMSHISESLIREEQARKEMYQ